MNHLSYVENSGKALASALAGSIVGLVVAIPGTFFLLNNLSRLGYIAVALFGSFTGLGYGIFLIFVKNFARVGKAAVFLSADEKGVDIAAVGTVARRILWQDIQDFSPGGKGIQKGLVVRLKNPDAHVTSLPRKEQKLAEQNARMFGSPVFVNTRLCTSSNEQIASELNSCMQSVLRKA